MSCDACARSGEVCAGCGQRRCRQHLLLSTELRVDTVIEQQVLGFSGPFGHGQHLPMAQPVFGPVAVQRLCLFGRGLDGVERLLASNVYSDAGAGDGPAFVRGFRRVDGRCEACRTANGQAQAASERAEAARAKRAEAERVARERERARNQALVEHHAFVDRQPGGAGRLAALQAEHLRLRSARDGVRDVERVAPSALIDSVLVAAPTTMVVLIVVAAVSTQLPALDVLVWPVLGLLGAGAGVWAWRAAGRMSLGDRSFTGAGWWSVAVFVVAASVLNPDESLAGHLADTGPGDDGVFGVVFLVVLAVVPAVVFGVGWRRRRRVARERDARRGELDGQLAVVAAGIASFRCRSAACPICRP